VLRASLFDFPAFDIRLLEERRAHIVVDYRRGPVAEEAACHQTIGFCEGVLSLAGVRAISASFLQRWAGDSQTLIVLAWRPPGAQRASVPACRRRSVSSSSLGDEASMLERPGVRKHRNPDGLVGMQGVDGDRVIACVH
jgi:hypothetical protein